MSISYLDYDELNASLLHYLMQLFNNHISNF